MSGDLPVPGAVLTAIAPVPFPVLDEQRTDVHARLNDEATRAGFTTGTLTVPARHTQGVRDLIMLRLPRIAGNLGIEDWVRAWLLEYVLRTEVVAALQATDRPAEAAGLLEVTRHLGREVAGWAGARRIPSYRHRERVAHEYDRAAHAGNAALYATSLGGVAGEHRVEMLQGIALAAVFADAAIDAPTDAERLDHAITLMRHLRVPSVGALAGVIARRAHWDGSGTPKGVAGPAIPFEGRCVAIASDYDLLTLSGHPGEGLAPFDAMSRMSHAAGVYEPALLRTFIALIGGTAIADPGTIERAHYPGEAERLRVMALLARTERRANVSEGP